MDKQEHIIVPSQRNGEVLECITTALGRNGELAQAFVNALIDDFVEPFKNRLAGLTFRRLIARKNPYLYRASGISSIEELVGRALGDFVSSSTGTFFGVTIEHFITSLPGLIKSSAPGVDVEKRSGHQVELFAIKSGPGGYNSSSFKTQREHLATTKTILEHQSDLVVRAFVGFAYGRQKDGRPAPGYMVLSSKNLWARLSGDQDFYTKVLEAYGCVSKFYEGDVETTHERMLIQAKEGFSRGSDVDWTKVLQASSG
jgi:hypothetical protein